MSTVTFNLSFQDALIREVDALAKRESRTRSELLREAARLYIQRQKRWESAFALGDAMVREAGLEQRYQTAKPTKRKASKFTAKRCPMYVTDSAGRPTGVILPIDEYESLIQDLADLAVAADRSAEPVVSHERVVEELKADGYL